MQKNDNVEVDFYLAYNLQKCNKSMRVCDLEVLFLLNCCEFLKFVIRLEQKKVVNSLNLA